jgi:hypothetical protein
MSETVPSQHWCPENALLSSGIHNEIGIAIITPCAGGTYVEYQLTSRLELPGTTEHDRTF